jgi:thiol-disulfide isomerase/thioredoxin
MRVFAIGGLVCGLALWAMGCSEDETQAAALAGDKVFPPQLHEWKDFEGRDIDLSDYQGKIVVLNFWATWCGPCRYEIPALVQMRDEYDPEQVAIIGVSLDQVAADKAQPLLGKFVERFAINYPILHDSQAQLISTYYKQNLNTVAVPMTYVFDQQGRLYRTHRGVPTDKNRRPNPRSVLGEDIEKLLNRS